MNTVLQHAVADPTFRAEVAAAPASFGATAAEVAAITPIDQPSEESVDFLTDGISNLEMAACVQSCSFGPITAVCDGNTK